MPSGLCIALFGAALALINFSVDEIVNPKLKAATRSQIKKWKLEEKAGKAKSDAAFLARQCCPCRSKGVRGIMIETIQNNVLPPVYEQDPVLEIDDFCVDTEPRKPCKPSSTSISSLVAAKCSPAGESGCGKSTLAYGVNRLLKPPAVVTSGRVVFNSREGYPIDVRALEGEDLRMFRWEKISMVFQGAMNSLNPVKKIKDQLGDVHSPPIART